MKDPSEGFIFGGSLGYQFVNDDSFDHHPDNMDFNIYTGYQMNKYIIVDIGYQSYTPLKGAQIEVENQIFESTIRSDYYLLNSPLSLYGRAGIAYWDLEKKIATNNIKESGVSLLGEVGISYSFSPQLVASFGYQIIPSVGDNSSTGTMQSNSFLTGIMWKFGNSEKENALAEQKILREEERRILIEKKHNEELDRRKKLNEEIEKEKLEIIQQEKDALKRQLKESESKRLLAEEALKKANNIALDKKVFDSIEITARFEKGHTTIEKEDLKKFEQALNNIKIQMLKNEKTEAVIVGHTDTSGSEKYNKWMSLKRAEMIGNKLKALGISSERLTIKGMGEEGAHGFNNPEDRKVDIVLICDECNGGNNNEK
ncbi:OmpA family protein [Aliivibrio fischeri]|uniref:OmpA family protein n=1 Tax=Aliivibrio fischeri TaxID=668 RepID=UPI00080E1A30|nr:OmpA family protein [Aliivibrio fischeri]OCH48787.1 hypothetical protein A6E02_08085 [Aliivibrio fischeri]